MTISLNGTSGGGSDPYGVNSIALDAPSGIQSGNLIIFFVGGEINPCTVTSPANFTDIENTNDTWSTNYFWVATWKIAGASEPSTYTWTFSGSNNLNTYTYVGLAYGGVNQSTPVDASATGSAQNTANYVCPSVSATGATDQLICGFLINKDSTTFTAPTNMTQQSSTQSDGHQYVSMAVADEALSSSGPTGTQTCTWGVSQNGIGTTVALLAAGSSFEPAWALGSNSFYGGGGGGGGMMALPSRQIISSPLVLPSYLTSGSSGIVLPELYLS